MGRPPSARHLQVVQFTVQRQDEGFGGPGPWKNRYTSSTWKASTDATHNASFSNTPPGVKVNVRNNAGKTPLQIAREKNAHGLILLFEQAGVEQG